MEVLTIDYTSPNVANKVSDSLKETGFVVLSNHPIPINLIEEAYMGWESFFSSDLKHNYLYQKPSQEGYFPFRTEKAKDYNESDLKEFFHFYPNSEVPENLKVISQTIYDELSSLAKEILYWIEICLPQQIAKLLSMPLNEMAIDSPQTLLRILHYPPLKNATDNAVRAAPHEDINLITLLPAATAPGLEVLNTRGEWFGINCDPGNLVVNAGDMLQMCTQHYYKSTTHRVINPSEQENRSRLSMPLFLHPRPDVQLSAECTAHHYLQERLKEIGIS